jgi:hypothetical protein
MDVAAELTALSAARQQAQMLNMIASLQTSENLFLQKAKVFDADIAHLQVSLASSFQAMNAVLRMYVRTFGAQAMDVARVVSKANGADALPIPFPGSLDHHLKPQGIRIFYFFKFIPNPIPVYYPEAYYKRDWGRGRRTAEPPHRISWLVTRGGVRAVASARLWLDVDPKDRLQNGGFPADGLSWVRNLGIQCVYPQFNARLVPTAPEVWGFFR